MHDNIDSGKVLNDRVVSSYRTKIKQLKELLANHNSQIEDTKLWIDSAKIMENLYVAGGTTDYALKACTWDDLVSMGIPRLLARHVADVFRSKEDVFVLRNKDA